MELRDYQIEKSYLARKALSNHKWVLVHGPTGSGKTLEATDIIIRAVAKNKTVVCLVDGEKILQQIAKKFIGAGLEFQILLAGNKFITPGYKVYLCMAETFYRRFSAGWFNEIKLDLCVIDEAHVGIYNKIIDTLKPVVEYGFGFTATPVASDKNEPLNKRWDTIITGRSVAWLIRNKHLVPVKEIGYNEILDFKVTNGEFDKQEQFVFFTKDRIKELLFKLWDRVSDRQTIIYCSNVEHAHEVEKFFKSKDVSCRCVTAKTSQDERNAILSAYEKELYQVLINVGVYTKGFDSPQTSCIVLAMDTASMSKYFQIIGRGGRPYQDKEDFILIDMGNNIIRHGSYHDPIDWKYIFENETRDKNFTVRKNVKLCPTCFTYYTNFFIPVCETCGNVFKENPMMPLIDAMPDNLKKPIEQMNLTELYQYAKIKGYKRGWAWMQFCNRSARKMGFGQQNFKFKMI